MVVGHGLDDVPTVVKHAAHRRLKMFWSCRLNICAVWNGPFFWESMNTRTPRLPRMAYSAAEPVSPEVALRMFRAPPSLGQGVFKQIAQQLHGHVFEGQGRNAGQPLDIQAVFQARF